MNWKSNGEAELGSAGMMYFVNFHAQTIQIMCTGSIRIQLVITGTGTGCVLVE